MKNDLIQVSMMSGVGLSVGGGPSGSLNKWNLVQHTDRNGMTHLEVESHAEVPQAPKISDLNTNPGNKQEQHTVFHNSKKPRIMPSIYRIVTPTGIIGTSVGILSLGHSGKSLFLNICGCLCCCFFR